MKIDVPFFDGVQLFAIEKFDLPGYYNILNKSQAKKLKFVYIDLYNQYALFYSNGLYTPFHDWLCGLVISRLKEFHYGYKYNYGFFNKPTADIEFLDRQVEVETGLKKSYSGLKKRLYRNPHFVYVVVPNSQIKKRYKNNLKQFHGRVYSIKEFYDLKEL